MKIEEDEILTGNAKYAENVFYKVGIFKTNFAPGSADYEEPPEVREDKWGEFYEVKFTAPNEERYSAGGGYYASLEEAKAHMEKIHEK